MKILRFCPYDENYHASAIMEEEGELWSLFITNAIDPVWTIRAFGLAKRDRGERDPKQTLAPPYRGRPWRVLDLAIPIARQLTPDEENRALLEAIEGLASVREAVDRQLMEEAL